ncbi:MAG: TetR/AcrR family transcriptional regulator [Oscillospiraceae bacterium]|nr:TetR/AcrR family transcriptional regulator [Oscillospiraceae bacterium]MBR6678651.1 TetR/AcrR family transcriptional regulator [Oscillospiraceae bacterium]
MPPKPKFTREEIVAAALELVSEKGMSALTSRDLGARLGSSARPIFTVFSSMEEVQEAVRDAAMQHFESYAAKAEHYTPVFKQVGMQMILFAKEEPMLYQLGFMTRNHDVADFDDIYERLGEVAYRCLDVIQRDYALPREDAKALFEHVWIHTFGIGALCATGMCDFSEEQIVEMLGHDFVAMLVHIKSGQMKQPTVHPVQRPEAE